MNACVLGVALKHAFGELVMMREQIVNAAEDAAVAGNTSQ